MPSIMSALRQARNRVAYSLDESIDYSLPHIHILGLVGASGFPLFYWIWHSLFPQPYDNIWLTLIGTITALAIIRIDLLQKLPPFYLRTFWLFVCTYSLSFFFTFLLLKNECNMVWSMSTMAGLTLLVLVAHDWLLATLIHLLGSAVAIVAFYVTSSAPYFPETYLIQVPVYLFVVIAGGLFNYQSAKLRQAKLKALASVGADLAHELRTPLLSIDYNNKILLRQLSQSANNGNTDKPDQSNLLPDTFTKSLQLIQRDTAHANTVIDMLLMDLSSNNLNEHKYELHSIKTVVESALDRYPFSSPGESQKISVSNDFDFEFYGSDILLMHVLFNLIKNALASIDYDGHITIDITKGKGENRLTVLDNGAGIPADKIPFVFDEFFTHGKKGTGTGIGLAFCKKVMTSVGGNIHYDSVLDSFTSFSLTFPALSACAINSHKNRLNNKLLDGLREKKILVIDDEPGSLRQLLSSLPDNTLDLSITDNTHEAILFLKSHPCDLIIMDLSIKAMDCLTSIRVIREGQFFNKDQCENHKNLPILVFSEKPESDARKASIEAGATDYVRKHASINDLLLSLTHCIESASSIDTANKNRDLLTGKSVLIIDDQEINYIILCENLAISGLKTGYEASGKSALTRLENEHFDCVILDLHMPGLDGWQTVEAIRSGEPFTLFTQFEKIPVIALSGDPRPELLSRCLQSGFNTLLLKPVDDNLLLSTLAEHLAVSPRTTLQSRTVAVVPNEDTYSATQTKESFEAEANLLHDMLTPLLIIETGNQLLKQSIPQLVTQYKLSKKSGDHKNSLSALESLPSNIEQVIALNRSKAHELWDLVRDSRCSDSLSAVTRDFLRDIRILWKNIEISQTICVDYFLPELITHYRQNIDHMPPENTLTELELNELKELVVDSGKSIERITQLLSRYEREKTASQKIQANTSPLPVSN